MIKRILLIGGGLVLLVLFAVAAANYYSSYQASQYNDVVVPYLEKVIPKISTWDVDVIRAHMAAEALENISPERLSAVTNEFSKLGALKSFSTPKFDQISKERKGNALVGIKNTQTILTYHSQAVYENGEAKLTFKLIAEDEQPQLYYFNVQSAVLGT
ncbi:MAG TPA: hypothetical protein VJ904_11565 [Tichowtungia sp.]|nr:hypothetical protein [Tichowtungia sp.]